jgi:hypothetical protein
MSLLPAAATAWLVILVLAIANGALREAVLVPRLGLVAGTLCRGSRCATIRRGGAGQ